MDWTTLVLISHIVLWIVVLVQGVLILALARLVGQLMSRRFPGAGARIIDPGPEIGTRIDDWQGTDLLGRAVNYRFPRERGLFLLYVSPHCHVCAGLLLPARRFFGEIAAEVEGAWVIVLGSRELQVRYSQENGLAQQMVLAEDQLPALWRLGGAPFGLWIDAKGEVRSKGMVNNREQLESMANAARSGHVSIQDYYMNQANGAAHGPQPAAVTDAPK